MNTEKLIAEILQTIDEQSGLCRLMERHGIGDEGYGTDVSKIMKWAKKRL